MLSIVEICIIQFFSCYNNFTNHMNQPTMVALTMLEGKLPLSEANTS